MRKFWMVYVHGASGPTKRYYAQEQAEHDAKLLSRKEAQTAVVLETVLAFRPMIEVVDEFEGPKSTLSEEANPVRLSTPTLEAVSPVAGYDVAREGASNR